MSFIKYGIVTPDSQSDYDATKKAEFFDADGLEIADANNKDKLRKPIKITQEIPED